MTFKEYVDNIYGTEIDVYDIDEDELVRLHEEWSVKTDAGQKSCC